jgi:hypothetical protein
VSRQTFAATVKGSFKERRQPLPARIHRRESVAHILVIGLLLEKRLVAFRSESWRFAAAQLAQKIVFGLKRPAGKLPLVAMIVRLVRVAVAAVAVCDSEMGIG